MRFNITDRKGLALILMSSVILGIWAVSHTIALRNALLVCGTFVGILYWLEQIKTFPRYQPKNSSSFFYLNFLPLGMILLMLVWVTTHYFFFAQFPEKQWQELKSTWLRVLLGVVMGSATGIALQRNKKLAWLLWLGIWLSFVVLFSQYIPKAIAKQSFFATDFFGGYIYWAKFNGVLVGMILIAGLLGLMMDITQDRLRQSVKTVSALQNRWQTQLLIAYFFLGILFALYSFVFIFDAKNGVGVAGILFCCWFVLGGFWIIYQLQKVNQQVAMPMFKRFIFSYLIVITAFIGLAWQQVKNNPGWSSLFEDVALSVQASKEIYSLQPEKPKTPLRVDGQPVQNNTFERVTLAMVGYQLIRENPLGVGTFRSFAEQTRAEGIEFFNYAYTHSAWIDLGLAFGIPGLILLPLGFMVLLIISSFDRDLYYRGTILSLSLTFLVLYLVGEYAFQHGIEILFFISSLLSTLTLNVFDKK